MGVLGNVLLNVTRCNDFSGAFQHASLAQIKPI